MKCGDSTTYQQAQGTLEWELATKNEYNALMKNKTWDIVPKPNGKNIVGCNWVSKTKFNYNGCVKKQKACLMAKWFSRGCLSRDF